MPLRSDQFYNNRLYKLLTYQAGYSGKLLQELNALLHEEPDLVEFTHPNEGSYFHVICQNFKNQKNIAFRMIYALSNAGADPNVTDGKGNTPLHAAIIQGLADNDFDLIQALFRVGIDPRIVNHDGKTAGAYIKNKPQLTVLYKGYGKGIWNAVETSDTQETERLINGFIKIDCKHNSNKTLLDKARDLNCASVIHILADYQVTNEFVHSILACDWDRASIIYQHENQFLKLYPLDSIHRLTYIRTCSKSLLEYCLDTHSSKPWEILFQSSPIKIDVNILCTDGLPFFFHCFDESMSPSIRRKILLNSNMYMKSSKGETFLFHLIRLYTLNENEEYLHIFTTILSNNPLLITLRNEQEQTIVEVIEFTSSTLVYDKLRPFYNAIQKLLVLQLKNTVMIEQFILNNFGYNLLIFYKNKTLLMTKQVLKLLRLLKLRKGLPVLISSLLQAIADNDMVKFAYISKMKANIYRAKDSFGRTSAHLAVLHQRYDMLKFLCKKYKNLINTRDNLNRTPFHYACIMNDKTSIEILEQAKANQLIDCLNFCPNDYLLNHELCFEEFHAQDFSKNELQRKPSAINYYLKIAFYLNFKDAIEKNSIEDIKSLHHVLSEMGFHLKDFDPNSHVNDYVQGQRYIPFFFLTLRHRSIAVVKCLRELGLPVIGHMYILKSDLNENLKWLAFCSQRKELECLDIIDIIDDFDDDDELAKAFKQNITLVETIAVETSKKTDEQSDSNSEILSITQRLMNCLRKNRQNENIKSQTCVMS